MCWLFDASSKEEEQRQTMGGETQGVVSFGKRFVKFRDLFVYYVYPKLPELKFTKNLHSEKHEIKDRGPKFAKTKKSKLESKIQQPKI